MDVVGLHMLAREYCGKKRRPWPKSWLTPLANLLLLPLGLQVPLEAAFGAHVVYAAAPPSSEKAEVCRPGGE